MKCLGYPFGRCSNKYQAPVNQSTRFFLCSLREQGYPIVLSRAAYRALRNNDWKRPISQIQLYTKDRLFTCCRDIGNPSVCENCGYANCVEISQILALKPSALRQVL